MSINKLLPHVLVLPEDKATRGIALGFLMESRINARAIQILPMANGWLKVVNNFENDHIDVLLNHPDRILVLVIDGDNDDKRFEDVRKKIPDNLQGRVFVLGVKSEPEKLKKALSLSYEKIGQQLAQECVSDESKTWGHGLLAHQTEVAQLKQVVKDFLFLA